MADAISEGVMALSHFTLVDVGHAESLHLAVLLKPGREVECVTCYVLEDVESAAEEDLPARVGGDRTVVDCCHRRPRRS